MSTVVQQQVFDVQPQSIAFEVKNATPGSKLLHSPCDCYKLGFWSPLRKFGVGGHLGNSIAAELMRSHDCNMGIQGNFGTVLPTIAGIERRRGLGSTTDKAELTAGRAVRRGEGRDVILPSDPDFAASRTETLSNIGHGGKAVRRLKPGLY
jgi:hypothetical protein